MIGSATTGLSRNLVSISIIVLKSACEKAETQFMALLLNIASGRIVPCNCIADPGTDAGTVGEAVEVIDPLIGNASAGDCKLAQALAARINEGISLKECP